MLYTMQMSDLVMIMLAMLVLVRTASQEQRTRNIVTDTQKVVIASVREPTISQLDKCVHIF